MFSLLLQSHILLETVINNCILTRGRLSVLYSKQLKQLRMALDILNDQYLWHKMFISFCLKGGGTGDGDAYSLSRLDILAITTLLGVAELFLHRNEY